MMNRENDRMINKKISRARGSEQSIQPLENLHCISNSAMLLTGYRICDPATIARGKITDQSDESMRHPSGTSVVLLMIIPATRMKEISSASQKRLMIFGPSRKKLERSTSFLVAPHVMLYENKWDKRAWVKCIGSPPKKMKLYHGCVQIWSKL